MLNSMLSALLLGNFLAIGLLPRFFFRRDGRFNRRWIATAAPFFIVPCLLLLDAAGMLGGWRIDAARTSRFLLAAAASAGSIALLATTVAVHRVPLALWHQDDDRPVEIVTRGPYALVRHPFYAAFLLAFAAAVLAVPQVLVAVCLAWALAALTLTARREERRLSRSAFGEDYRRYAARTGRFLPRLIP